MSVMTMPLIRPLTQGWILTGSHRFKFSSFWCLFFRTESTFSLQIPEFYFLTLLLENEQALRSPLFCNNLPKTVINKQHKLQRILPPTHTAVLFPGGVNSSGVESTSHITGGTCTGHPLPGPKSLVLDPCYSSRLLCMNFCSIPHV